MPDARTAAPRPGAVVRLEIERVATGGRMIARLDGAVVLVAGAIPGEVVTARVERVQRHTVWARTIEVVTASPDRVPCPPELACGGHLLAHVGEARQRTLKGEMLGDAMRRVGRIDMAVPAVLGAAADGYRTRARIHVRGGRAGFFDEGSHRLCDVRGSRQLSDASADVLERLVRALAASAADLDAEIEWVEDAAGRRRVAHVSTAASVADAGRRWRVEGLDGLSWMRPREAGGAGAWGERRVVDELTVAGAASPVGIQHQAQVFFQGNRFLLQPLLDEVIGRISGTSVCDLYAGVGLFAMGVAAMGGRVDAVEGHGPSVDDLRENARAVEGVTCHAMSVETYLAGARTAPDTVIVDPPRSGLGADVVAGLLAWQAPRIVYVSCDPATLARDCRRLTDGGYGLSDLRGVDLFPRTGHVEAVVTLDRGAAA